MLIRLVVASSVLWHCWIHLVVAVTAFACGEPWLVVAVRCFGRSFVLVVALLIDKRLGHWIGCPKRFCRLNWIGCWGHEYEHEPKPGELSYLGPSSLISGGSCLGWHVFHFTYTSPYKQTEMEPEEQDNSITSALRDAISRIERLEGQRQQGSQLSLTQSSSSNSNGNAHTRSSSEHRPTTSTGTGTSSSGSNRPRPFLPVPMRRGAVASPLFYNNTNRPIRPSSAPDTTVTHEFRWVIASDSILYFTHQQQAWQSWGTSKKMKEEGSGCGGLTSNPEVYLSTVNPRLSPQGLICKLMNLWVGAYSRVGAYSEARHFPQTLTQNWLFITNLSLLFLFWSSGQGSNTVELCPVWDFSK